MATTPEYNEYVCERLEPFGAVRSRKMFGEYMVYLNDKPIISVCDRICQASTGACRISG